MDRKLAREIGERLRVLRKSMGLTQIAMADMMGISQNYLSELENGNCRLTSELYVKLNGVLGVSPNALILGRTDERRTGAPAVPGMGMIDAPDLRLAGACREMRADARMTKLPPDGAANVYDAADGNGAAGGGLAPDADDAEAAGRPRQEDVAEFVRWVETLDASRREKVNMLCENIRVFMELWDV